MLSITQMLLVYLMHYVQQALFKNKNIIFSLAI